MNDPRAMDEVWQRARAEADVIVELPRLAGKRVEMFFRKVEKTRMDGFQMGSRGGFPWEYPTHHVVIRNDFFLGTFVVNQEQWTALWPSIDSESGTWYPPGSRWGKSPGANPSQFSNQPHARSAPVEQVSWYDTMVYCQVLTRLGTFHVQNCEDGSDLQCCLPTESEWEYASRGGQKSQTVGTDFWNGDGEAALREVGWFRGNSGQRRCTSPVSEPVIPNRPEAHPLGLFGMHGNVWEWCHDEWKKNAYRDHFLADGDLAANQRTKILEGEGVGGPNALWALRLRNESLRVCRGGAWDVSAMRCRSAFRGWLGVGVRVVSRGFRICLVRRTVRGADSFGRGAGEPR